MGLSKMLNAASKKIWLPLPRALINPSYILWMLQAWFIYSSQALFKYFLSQILLKNEINSFFRCFATLYTPKNFSKENEFWKLPSVGPSVDFFLSWFNGLPKHHIFIFWWYLGW